MEDRDDQTSGSVVQHEVVDCPMGEGSCTVEIYMNKRV